MRALALATAAALAATPALAQTQPEGPRVTVDMAGPDGTDHGTATFRQMRRGLLIEVRLQNVPEGMHALFVANRGDCNPTFDSAGNRYAPRGMEHGYANPNGPQAGDLPNVHAAADGTVTADIFTERLSLMRNDLNTLADEDGSALILGAEPDSYDVTAEIGARIACGVITDA